MAAAVVRMSDRYNAFALVSVYFNFILRVCLIWIFSTGIVITVWVVLGQEQVYSSLYLISPFRYCSVFGTVLVSLRFPSKEVKSYGCVHYCGKHYLRAIRSVLLTSSP